MERLWMFAVLTGQISDYTWPDSDITITKPDGTTVSEIVSMYGDTCVGHRGSDVFPFGLLDTDDDGFEVTPRALSLSLSVCVYVTPPGM